MDGGVQSRFMGYLPEQQACPLGGLEYALPSRINFAWLPAASTRLELICYIKKAGKGTRLEDRV